MRLSAFTTKNLFFSLNLITKSLYYSKTCATNIKSHREIEVVPQRRIKSKGQFRDYKLVSRFFLKVFSEWDINAQYHDMLKKPKSRETMYLNFSFVNQPSLLENISVKSWFNRGTIYNSATNILLFIACQPIIVHFVCWG